MRETVAPFRSAGTQASETTKTADSAEVVAFKAKYPELFSPTAMAMSSEDALAHLPHVVRSLNSSTRRPSVEQHLKLAAERAQSTILDEM